MDVDIYIDNNMNFWFNSQRRTGVCQLQAKDILQRVDTRTTAKASNRYRSRQAQPLKKRRHQLRQLQASKEATNGQIVTISVEKIEMKYIPKL